MGPHPRAPDEDIGTAWRRAIGLWVGALTAHENAAAGPGRIEPPRLDSHIIRDKRSKDASF